MSDNNTYYHVSEYGDRLTPGNSIKINHALSFINEKADISELAALPIDKLNELRVQNINLETGIYNSLLESAREWARVAAYTMLIDKAVEYIKVPAVKHSSNKWDVNEFKYHNISNMVYKMSWNIYEETRFDRAQGKSIPVAWYASWEVRTNAPCIGNDYNRGTKIAGQIKKRFTDKAAVDKYITGRIAAYAHLFAEISPPLPQKFAAEFTVNGLLMPGYKLADNIAVQPESDTPVENQPEGGKTSVLGMIAESREEQRRTKGSGHDKSPPDKKTADKTEH